MRTQSQPVATDGRSQRGPRRLVRAALPAALGAGALVAGLAAAAETLSPDRVPGLAAWYPAGSAHHELRDKQPVETWYDESGNGHDLVAVQRGLYGLFRTVQLNRHPTVRLSQGVHYRVTDPLVLGDHTIFLVYRSALTTRALFSREDHGTTGVVLGEGSARHVFRPGGVGVPVKPYTERARPQKDFQLLMLGREAGRLRAMIDGEDVSSFTPWEPSLHVGTMFHVEYSVQVDQDGGGMEIAEMIFYDRFLDTAEISGVTSYLVGKYALGVQGITPAPVLTRVEAVAPGEDGVARLGTSRAANANDAKGAGLVWDRPDAIGAPFRVDAKLPSRIYADAKVERARVLLSLSLESTEPDVAVRALLLRNNEEYLPDGAQSEPFGGPSSPRVTLEIDTTLALAAGDFLEVVTFATGAEGAARIVPGETVLLLEAR